MLEPDRDELPALNSIPRRAENTDDGASGLEGCVQPTSSARGSTKLTPAAAFPIAKAGTKPQERLVGVVIQI